MTSAAVIARDLVKSFGPEIRALDGVSLEVQPGTVLGLLGPNGAGKTTAVNILTTLLRPDSGHAEVAGVDVVRDPATARQRIGLAGQYPAVDENLTGMENLVLVGKLNHLPKNQSRARAAELLDHFGLADAGGRATKGYSGGMRRRLDLAAALVADPAVLFLDEPTTGLDPRSRIDLWSVIEDLVRGGTTVLLTTQYLEEADRLADRISVVDHGRVIAEGTAAELKAQMGGSLVEVSLDDAEQAGEVAGLLSGVGEGEVSVHDNLVDVPARNGTAVLSAVVRRLDEHAVIPKGLQLREPSLDDVFLALTGRPAEDDSAPGNDDSGNDDSGNDRSGHANGSAHDGRANDGGASGDLRHDSVGSAS